MNHLSTSDVVDAVEGTLDERRAAHLAACAACREQTDALRATMTRAATVDVPEPSPLFWDHFSDRVRQAVSESPASFRAWWRHPAIGFASAAVAAVIVFVALRPPHQVTPAIPAPVTAAVPSPAGAAAPDAIDAAPSTDDAWTVLRAAASDMALSDAHAVGLNVRPSSVDRAVLDLTPGERTELERLLREELKHPGD
jgi:hypothetical protein